MFTKTPSQEPRLVSKRLRDGRWRKNSPERVRQASNDWRQENQEKSRNASRMSSLSYAKANPSKVNEKGRRWRAKVKVETLGHYGPLGEVRCSWLDCEISDPDMLTLDHIKDDGAVKRRQGEKSGIDLYMKLRSLGWPGGFQTLCHNHQWKKQILKLKKGG